MVEYATKEYIKEVIEAKKRGGIVDVMLNGIPFKQEGYNGHHYGFNFCTGLEKIELFQYQLKPHQLFDVFDGLKWHK